MVNLLVFFIVVDVLMGVEFKWRFVVGVLFVGILIFGVLFYVEFILFYFGDLMEVVEFFCE